MHRRRFLVLALGVMVAGGCGTGGSRAPMAGRLTLVAPAARGQGWDRAARALAMVLTGDRMARAAEVSNHPGGLGASALSAFPAARGSFAREGRMLLTGMPMVAGAEIANAASVAESTTPWPAWSATGRPWSSRPARAFAPSRTSPRCSTAIPPR